MGRKTFESIGKPLSNRLNIILTKDKDFKADGCLVFNDIFEVLLEVMKESQVFIIGGGEIYKQFFPMVNRIYTTLVDGDYEGDTYFPQYDKKDWDCFYEEKKEGFSYQTWIRKK
jgi:dihydrofolate reductase